MKQQDRKWIAGTKVVVSRANEDHLATVLESGYSKVKVQYASDGLIGTADHHELSVYVPEWNPRLGITQGL